MNKMNPFDICMACFDVAAGVGVDVILTAIAKNVVPQSFGVPGAIQKVCVKAASIGLSFVASEAMDKVVRDYVKEISDELKAELDKDLAK